MSFLRLTLAAFIVALGLSQAGAQDAPAVAAFVPGFEDLPLMTGLTGDPDAAVHFDTADGRILEGAAFGGVSAKAVRDFYVQTLPQMGWRRVGKTEWTREGERLSLAITQTATTLVRFTIAPE